MNHTIEQAVEQFRNQAAGYRRTKRYYAGEHNLNFATEKFANTFGDLFREFALNMCPAIVDAMRDKLKIAGFGIDSVGSPHVSKGSSWPQSDVLNGNTSASSGDGTAPDRPHRALPHGRATDTLHDIWRRNRMAIRAGEVHKEALKNGDAYVIVWPAADGSVQIFPNAADSVTVHYDEEQPGRVAWAAKHWRDAEKRTRLNLFFPDRVERYVSKGDQGGFLPEAKDFVAAGPGRWTGPRASLPATSDHTQAGMPAVQSVPAVQPNPFGVVPVFHFANNADIGEFGRSELEAAMPVQDGLNKAVLDMLVAMEVCAYRQRWAAGIEIQYDAEGKAVAPFKAGIDHLWLAENPDAKFGDFAAADLEQFLKVKDGFRIDIASVTGTPLYYLMPQLRGFPSGESLRKAETRFIAKVRDRQEQFGAVWADVMAFALRIAGHADTSLVTRWEDPSPLTERELLENLILKKQLGISTEQALKEAGYGDIDARKFSRE